MAPMAPPLPPVNPDTATLPLKVEFLITAAPTVMPLRLSAPTIRLLLLRKLQLSMVVLTFEATAPRDWTPAPAVPLFEMVQLVMPKNPVAPPPASRTALPSVAASTDSALPVIRQLFIVR